MKNELRWIKILLFPALFLLSCSGDGLDKPRMIEVRRLSSQEFPIADLPTEYYVLDFSTGDTTLLTMEPAILDTFWRETEDDEIQFEQITRRVITDSLGSLEMRWRYTNKEDLHFMFDGELATHPTPWMKFGFEQDTVVRKIIRVGVRMKTMTLTSERGLVKLLVKGKCLLWAK